MGFQSLGTILLPLARAQLNSAFFDEAVVQDCVQEALLAIWQKLSQGQGPNKPDSFIQWSIRFVIFRSIDYARWVERHPVSSLEGVASEVPLLPLPNTTSEAALLPEHLVELNDDKVRLLLSIRHHPSLSMESKQILIEGFLFEKNDTELAALVSTSYGNVQVIRSRNCKKLRSDQAWIAQVRG